MGGGLTIIMELFQGYRGGSGILEILKDGRHTWYGMDPGGNIFWNHPSTVSNEKLFILVHMYFSTDNTWKTDIETVIPWPRSRAQFDPKM